MLALFTPELTYPHSHAHGPGWGSPETPCSFAQLHSSAWGGGALATLVSRGDSDSPCPVTLCSLRTPQDTGCSGWPLHIGQTSGHQPARPSNLLPGPPHWAAGSWAPVALRTPGFSRSLACLALSKHFLGRYIVGIQTKRRVLIFQGKYLRSGRKGSHSSLPEKPPAFLCLFCHPSFLTGPPQGPPHPAHSLLENEENRLWPMLAAVLFPKCLPAGRCWAYRRCSGWLRS